MQINTKYAKIRMGCESMTYYPINLKLNDKRCVVVGGGTVAQRKVLSLLAGGALVMIISPNITDALRELVFEDKVVYLARPYQVGDVQNFFIVVCASDDRLVNAAAAREAKAYGALVNSVDDLEACDFFVPAQVAQGDLLFTVSTGGKSPAMTKLLCEEIAENYGAEYGLYLEFVAKLRNEIKPCIGSTAERELFWQKSLNREILSLLKAGKLKEAEAEIRNAVSRIGIKS